MAMTMAMTMATTLVMTLVMTLALVTPAQAGPWEATQPDGRVLRIVQDSTRIRDGYVLERRYPSGEADAQFGSAGAQLFSLGADNEGPASLRSDALGRAWVAGASVGPQGARAVVLRFTPQGQPDTHFAQQGRSAVAPAGQQARALDLAPLGDGSAWVAGQVIDPQGAERTGAWRLLPNGSVDPRFGLGGLWRDREAGATEPAAVRVAPDGSVALGLRRSTGEQAWLETWAWPADGTVPRLLSRTAVPAADAAGSQLSWRSGQWQWLDAKGRVPASAAVALPTTTFAAAAASQVSIATVPAKKAALSPPGTPSVAASGTAARGWAVPALWVAALAVLAALATLAVAAAAWAWAWAWAWWQQRRRREA